MNDLIEHVAIYIDKLKADHPANKAFGVRLKYARENLYVDPENTIFPYAFSLSESDDAYEAGTLDLHGDNRPGIAIVPISGERPRYAMDAWTPYFHIDCRHRIVGCAFRCLQYLTYELNLNSRVFPQNGCVFALSSQPTRIYGDPRNNVFVFRSHFRVLVAEPIK